MNMELETIVNSDGTYHLNVWNGSDLWMDCTCAGLAELEQAKAAARREFDDQR